MSFLTSKKLKIINIMINLNKLIFILIFIVKTYFFAKKNEIKTKYTINFSF